MANKQRNPRYVTEIGVANYPHLTKPDTKFKAEGEFKCNLKLPAGTTLFDAKGKKVGKLEDFLTEAHEAAVEQAKRENEGKRIKEADLPFIEDAEGNTEIRAKLKALVTPKKGDPFNQKPALFDAKGNPIAPDAVWSGSRMKVAFEIIPFYTTLAGAGISLRLKACQIIELRAGGDGGDADAFGFGEEDGYEASDEDNSSAAGFGGQEEEPEGSLAGDEDGDF